MEKKRLESKRKKIGNMREQEGRRRVETESPKTETEMDEPWLDLRFLFFPIIIKTLNL